MPSDLNEKASGRAARGGRRKADGTLAPAVLAERTPVAQLDTSPHTHAAASEDESAGTAGTGERECQSQGEADTPKPAAAANAYTYGDRDAWVRLQEKVEQLVREHTARAASAGDTRGAGGKTNKRKKRAATVKAKGGKRKKRRSAKANDSSDSGSSGSGDNNSSDSSDSNDSSEEDDSGSSSNSEDDDEANSKARRLRRKTAKRTALPSKEKIGRWVRERELTAGRHSVRTEAEQRWLAWMLASAMRVHRRTDGDEAVKLRHAFAFITRGLETRLEALDTFENATDEWTSRKLSKLHATMIAGVADFAGARQNATLGRTLLPVSRRRERAAAGTEEQEMAEYEQGEY